MVCYRFQLNKNRNSQKQVKHTRTHKERKREKDRNVRFYCCAMNLLKTCETMEWTQYKMNTSTFLPFLSLSLFFSFAVSWSPACSLALNYIHCIENASRKCSNLRFPKQCTMINFRKWNSIFDHQILMCATQHTKECQPKTNEMNNFIAANAAMAFVRWMKI